MAVSTEKWRCQLKDNNMRATLYIEPTQGESISVEDINAYLHQNGVTTGIIYSEIENMLRTGIYYKDVVVARGTAAVDGIDGYYDMQFDMGQIKHPTIRSDGSVDYQSMRVIHSVKKGDVLAIYHPAVPGKHGIDVKGRELRCKPGKEQLELKGSGFDVEVGKDVVTYRANIEGRIEHEKNKLYVRDVYEYRGDLDLITGRIDFRGDVVIYGNVRTGTTIRAAKSITIEGSVESAVLIAEGDIVIKKGMQGGNKAKIAAGGSVYAYFLEYTDVSARGNVEANIILNCKVSAGKSIIVKGRKGYIVGGNYEAISQISSTNIGNQAQVKTNVAVGLSQELNTRNHLLNVKYENTRKSIESAKQSIETLNDIRITDAPKEVREAKINQIRRRLKRDERLLEHVQKELDQIRGTMELGMHSRVSVEGKVFPGVTIQIDDQVLKVKDIQEKQEYYKPSGTETIESRTIS